MAGSYRIHCSASDEHSLAIVNAEVVLAKADPCDDRQVWFKDEKCGAGLKDKAGSPAFALVNKSTGETLKHPFGCYCPVRAIKLDPRCLDASVLWAESEDDLGGGFRRVHALSNMDLVFDAERATPRHGGARDGTRLILCRWNGGDNQLWRITPRSAATLEAPEHARRVRILCQSDRSLSLTVRDGAAVLARANDKDERQCWVKSFRNAGNVTDREGHRAFALVNWATGKALRHSRHDEPVQLVGHSPDSVDVALLWTLGDDLGEGFHGLRMVNNVDLVLDAANGIPETGGAHDGTPIIVFLWNSGPNQKWKMLPFY
ncbi:hypothetical protein ACP70R_016608 [Stipagrostis hirtigluma subsp. patula]